MTCASSQRLLSCYLDQVIAAYARSMQQLMGEQHMRSHMGATFSVSLLMLLILTVALLSCESCSMPGTVFPVLKTRCELGKCVKYTLHSTWFALTLVNAHSVRDASSCCFTLTARCEWLWNWRELLRPCRRTWQARLMSLDQQT